MLIDSMIHFRRAKSAETLDMMFNGSCRKADLDPVKVRTSRGGLRMSFQQIAEHAYSVQNVRLYFLALAAAHRLVEIGTGRTQDFVIDRLVIGRDASAKWIVEARDVMFREAFNQLEDAE